MERTSLHHRTNFSRIQNPLKLRSIVQSKALFTLAGLGVLCFSCYFVGTAFNSRTNAWETSFFTVFWTSSVQFLITKTDNMSSLELWFLSSKLQSKCGAMLQLALRKTIVVNFPIATGYQMPFIASKARAWHGLVLRSLTVDSQAVNRIQQISNGIVKATNYPPFY